MDSILFELSIIWNNIVAMDTDQQVALGLLIYLSIIYSLSASASFTLTKNGIERKIEKVRNWPGYLMKAIWIIIALNFGLWTAVLTAILTVYITITHIQIIKPLLLIAKPTISAKEKKKLENSF